MLNKYKSHFLILCIAWQLISCSSSGNFSFNSSFGSVQEENIQTVFLESILEDQQEVIFYSRAIWYPNKNEFKFLTAWKKSRKGVIAYTNHGIYFSEWNAKRNNTEFSASYDQLEELHLAANDLFGRIVIKKAITIALKF